MFKALHLIDSNNRLGVVNQIPKTHLIRNVFHSWGRGLQNVRKKKRSGNIEYFSILITHHRNIKTIENIYIHPNLWFGPPKNRPNLEIAKKSLNCKSPDFHEQQFQKLICSKMVYVDSTIKIISLVNGPLYFQNSFLNTGRLHYKNLRTFGA